MSQKPNFSEKDQEELATLEVVVDQWLDKTAESGKALLEIKQRRLYLMTEHATFEAYVRMRFGKTRQWAYDQCNRALIAAETGFDLPANVVQPLKGLDSKTQKTVLSKAAKKAKAEKRDKPSRQDVDQAIAEISAAKNVKAAAARKTKPKLSVVAKGGAQRSHHVVIYTTHRTEVLEVLREFGDDLVVTTEGDTKKPIEFDCPSVSSIGRYLFAKIDKLPNGISYELSIHGQVTEGEIDQKSQSQVLKSPKGKKRSA